MNELSRNINFDPLQQVLKTKTEELGKNVNSSSSKLSDDEKNKFAKVSRGFEAMFINMMLKEMKTTKFSDEDSDFDGPLSEYTDILFSEQVSTVGAGIGIAEKVYKFLTGEELAEHKSSKIMNTPVNAIKNFSNEIKINTPVTEVKHANAINETPISGNFVNKVKNRLEVYDNIIDAASAKYNVPKELIKAVITVESAGHNHAKSKAGAKGLMQLMDGTARDLGVVDSFDPAQNIFGGTLYLRRMMNKFGNLDNALAAYNAGPGNVEKYGGIPPFKETQSYVKKVNKYLNTFKEEKIS
ncbi:hypothetical protein MASR1M45_12030 [Candidatus Kapaibacterium sp.]